MKKLLLLTAAFCFLAYYISFSQSYQWAKSFGSTGSDAGYSVAVDGSGNVYVTGNFLGTADFDPGAGTANLSSAGLADIFLTKYDAAGNYLWAKSFGNTGNDAGYSVAVDGSGNVYITGNFLDTADFDPGAGTANLSSAGSSDIFFAKYDAGGNYLWANRIGSASTDFGKSIVVDGNGSIYITGYFQGTADFDPNAGTANLISTGSSDIFFAKYDAGGNYLLAKNIGSTSADIGNSIAVDGSGSIYITGYFQGTADFDPSAGVFNLASAGSTDMFISKLDASGNFVWAKRIGNSMPNIGNSIALDSAGNVYTTGLFEGSVDFDPGAGIFTVNTSGSNEDIFISKLNASGNFVWAKGMGDNDVDIGNSIAVDSVGNVYTTGYFGGTVDFNPGAGTFNLISTGGGSADDIFINKLDSSGNFVWAKNIGSTGNDEGNSIAVDGSDNVYLTGYFRNTADFDPSASTANLTSVGNDDVFYAKYCPLSATLTKTAISCNGGNDGTATATANGTPPYTYLWSNGQTTSTATGLIAGTYTCVINGANSCMTTQTVTVTQPTALTANMTSNPTNCSSNTGTATANASGGTNPYTYLWSDGQTTWQATALGAGNYTVTLTDANACTKTATVTVSYKAGPTVNTSTNQSNCGSPTGTATATASGGNNPFTYLWSNGQTTAVATGLNAGSYTVTVTNAVGCTTTATVIVTYKPSPSVTTSTTPSFCSSATGTATANASGATPPYTYFWSSGQTTSVATAISAGVYTITVTDANGCTTSVSDTVTYSIPPSAPSICAVTVDSLSQNNIIAWDKAQTKSGDTVFVYRDTANNAYGLIGKIPYDSLSWWIDTARTLYAANGDPNLSSWRYKISVKDSCGNQGAMSPYHQSLFMQNNSGNFNWTEYKIEGQPLPVPPLSNYLFQRDNLSNWNWITIGTLSASSVAFTDPNYLTYQSTATWRVQTAWSISCTPSIKNPIPMGTINTTRSNTFKTGAVAVNETSFENMVSVYPNPFTETTTLRIANSKLRIADLKLFDVVGQVQKMEFFRNADGWRIHCGELENGIYFLKVTSDRGIVVKKIIIND